MEKGRDSYLCGDCEWFKLGLDRKVGKVEIKDDRSMNASVCVFRTKGSRIRDTKG